MSLNCRYFEYHQKYPSGLNIKRNRNLTKYDEKERTLMTGFRVGFVWNKLKSLFDKCLEI